MVRPQAGEFVHRTGHEFHAVRCKIQREHGSVMWHLDDFLAGLSIPQLRRAVRGGCGNVPSAAGRDVEIFDILPVAHSRTISPAFKSHSGVVRSPAPVNADLPSGVTAAMMK